MLSRANVSRIKLKTAADYARAAELWFQMKSIETTAVFNFL